MSEQKLARQVSLGSIVANVLLSLGKLLAGIFGHSAALISDAVHSASDVFSTVVVLLGLRIAARDPDREHEYGHERMECISAILLAVILFLTALMIGWQGISSFGKEVPVPGLITLIAAAVSILVKELMFQVTKRVANTINSPALMADAWHHRSDALSSVGSLVGVFSTRLGFVWGDSLASLVICVFIMKAAVDIFRSAANQLTDTSCDKEEEMRCCAEAVEGVCRVDSIKTRQFGAKIYVDLEISADGTLTLYQAHDIAEQVHLEIEQGFPGVKHCMVHVNPA